jgi:hypothetical protein
MFRVCCSSTRFNEEKIMAKKDKKKKSKIKTKAQWPTWSAPFQRGSNLHTFSQAMMKRGGLSLKGFMKLQKKTGAKATWILKCLRKGSAGGWSWDFDDSRDRYVITNVKLHKKEV